MYILPQFFKKQESLRDAPHTASSWVSAANSPSLHAHTHVFHTKSQPSSFYSKRKVPAPNFFSIREKDPSCAWLIWQPEASGWESCSALLTWYNQGTQAARCVAQSPTSIPALGGVSAKIHGEPPRGQTRTKTERDGRGCAECPQHPRSLGGIAPCSERDVGERSPPTT